MNSFIQVLGWALIHALWQGCLPPQLGSSITLCCPGSGKRNWSPHCGVTLDAPWQTSRSRMEKPKS
jgi:hypothetical protein